MLQVKYATFLSAVLVASIGAFVPFSSEAAAWPGFSRGMGIGGWLYYEIVKGLQ
jgi:hypothetical protein